MAGLHELHESWIMGRCSGQSGYYLPSKFIRSLGNVINRDMYRSAENLVFSRKSSPIVNDWRKALKEVGLGTV